MLDQTSTNCYLNQDKKPARTKYLIGFESLYVFQNVQRLLLAARLSELDSAEDMVLFCKSGARSTRALELLTSAGFKKVKNLKGGINAWAREVDTSLPIY